MTARQAYETGLACVERKVRMALQLYHELLTEFDDYGNRCLGDTFFKGLPEFFRWYDMKFEPQNTILMLDYPVLRDLSSLTGVDRIYEFLRCLSLEQEFLKGFPAGCVQQLLDEYAGGYRNRIENLCEIVLIVLFRSFSGTREQLRSAVRQLLEKQYGERGMLLMTIFQRRWMELRFAGKRHMKRRKIEKIPERKAFHLLYLIKGYAKINRIWCIISAKCLQ